MGQFINLFEFIAIAALCVLAYAFIKTIFQTIKTK